METPDDARIESDATWSPVDRGWYVVLDFRRIDVRGIDEAIALHAEHPGAVRMLDERGGCIYRNTYRAGDLAEFRSLWRLAGDWPGVQAHLGGWPADRGDIDAFTDCHVDHVLSEGRDVQACADYGEYPSYLGCRDRHIRLSLGPTMIDPERPHWFDFARPVAKSQWMLDRHRMRSFLSPLRRRAACPALSWPLMESAIDRLPEQLEVAGIWRYEPNPLGYPAPRRLVPRNADRYHAFLSKLFREGDEWRPISRLAKKR